MRTIALLILLGLMISSAAAHSLYAEFPQDTGPDSQTEFWIAYGHGGSADSQIESLPLARLISPDGSEGELFFEPYRDGLKGSVAFDDPGCYILDLQMDTTFFDPASFGAAGKKSLVEKYGRVLMPYQSGEGYDWSSRKGMEIVPETDPYQLKSGEDFRARVLYNGKPVPGSYSAIITRSPEDVLVVQHAQESEISGESEDGIISFATGRAGLWVLAYEATMDESGTWTAVKDDPSENYKKGDQIEYEEVAPTAYLTFWVND
jgi:cobalt/nickel transport protein